jgi:hypothetical protein
MKITLPNGLSIEGDSEQIQNVLNSLGYKGIGDGTYYYSDSKGPILIAEMNSMHLRNAILKFYKEWVDELHKETNPKKVVNQIVDGINDPTWVSMVKELNKREE